jgi:formylglycine-generating enzyme required for sulfatase activity
MRNIATLSLAAVLALAVWPLRAPAQDNPETTFTAENARVVEHQPSTAPTGDAWTFNAHQARRRQKDAAETLGSPVNLSLPLDDKTVLKLVLIPSGSFNMGSPRDEKYSNADEARHRVTITKPFYMGIYPVTQEQWEQVMGKNLSQFPAAKRPVENVTYEEAVQFCYKAS